MKLKTMKKTEKGAPAGGSAGESASAQAANPAAKTEAAVRACPTRADGVQPLFQHSVTTAQCQSKQRGMYHKCFTCAHSNAHR